MKRIPALQPLSREHQPALALALQAKKAAAGDTRYAIDQVCQAILVRFPAEIEPHFQVEENHLLPLLEQAGEAALAERTRAEHAAIRAAFTGINVTTPATMRHFGELLEQHIRFEERVLFETAQQALPIDALQVLCHA